MRNLIGRDRRAADAVKPVASGDHVAVQRLLPTLRAEADAWTVGAEVVDRNAFRPEDDLPAGCQPRRDQVLHHLVLAVDHYMPPGQGAEIDAMVLASEAQPDALMQQALVPHPLADAGLHQDVLGRVLQHARPDTVFHVVTRARFQDNRVDALQMQQMGQQQPGRPRPDNPHPRAHAPLLQRHPSCQGVAGHPLPGCDPPMTGFAASPPGTVRIGISGWTYPPWRGVFYPRGLAQTRELEYAASRFRTIEINGTFYGLQRPESFADWAHRTPADFLFAVKGSRYITHMLKLREPRAPLANFLASGLLCLGPKLGPILWQFPPNFAFNRDRLSAFFELLPHDTKAAAALAATHDGRLAGRAWTSTDALRPLRHAVEIRHDSFRSPAFIDLLRKHGIALVCADTVSWPRLMDVTSDFVYCRLHGSEELYASGYDAGALDAWAARVIAWARGTEPHDAERVGGPARRRPRDVFAYFDNDMKVRAPEDARGLEGRIARLMAASP